MKKLFLFTILLLSATWLFAGDTLVAPAPNGTGVMSVSDYFMSAEGIVALVLLLTGYVTTHWITADGAFLKINYKQWVSYVLSMGVCFFGLWKGLGIFSKETIPGTLLDGISYGLVANGVYTIPFVQTAMTAIRAKKKN